MSKKITRVVTLMIVAMFFLTACNKPVKKVEEGTKKLKIVATIYPQYDFIKQIVKDKAEVVMLLKPGAESHSYEPTPKDIQLASNSELLINVGGDNDVWIYNILNSLDKKPEILTLSKIVDTVDEVIVEGMEHRHEHGEEHSHEFDEHVWTSPINAIKIVNMISAKIIEKDPENKEFYENNTKAYVSKLNELDTMFKDVTKNAKRDLLVFGDRFPFRYFTDEYNLRYYAAFSGCSTDSEASAATVAFLVDKVKEEKVPVVFHIELSNAKIAQAIADATGAKVLEFNSAHNVTADQLKDNISYYDIMLKNVEMLKEALN